MKSRQQMYLDEEMTAWLDELSNRSGECKSAIMLDALRDLKNRRGGKELDDLLGKRLGRMERDLHVLMESFALFVRYQLTVTAPVAEADEAARAVGQDRYQSFINQVGRLISSGRGFKQDVLAHNPGGTLS